MMKEKLVKFIGCPFKDGGRGTEIDPITNKPFYDCYGLFMAVYKEIYGIELPDVCVSACDVLEIHRLYEIYRKHWKKIESPVEPCAVAMSLPDKRFGKSLVNHFGVYVGDGMFIHILETTYSHIARVDSPVYSKLIRGFYVYDPESRR